jgi:hypothetical protein
VTTTQFRQNSVYTGALRNALDDAVVVLALQTLLAANPPIDPDPGDPEIASVRALSQMVGYNEFYRQLRLLAEPLQEPVELTAEFKPEDE